LNISKTSTLEETKSAIICEAGVDIALSTSITSFKTSKMQHKAYIYLGVYFIGQGVQKVVFTDWRGA
jgi:hypothetical protein